ncbi:MAG: hypothetical protein OEO79_08090 [Gemmatimonadota bacterium]|nr:hypothetical protein [Gemmatimonadota bacterium]MDH3421790.1 hypothetical protein [Gemmatimonadota bacterium]
MDFNLDRRAFLRRAALAALSAPAVGVLACTPDVLPRERRGEEGVGRTLNRPILLPWGPDGVRIAAPPSERPVAYMSMGRMEIYIDRDFRDRLQYALSAHISVSTGHWRIPRPGDSPLVPVQPGDAQREYEEIDLREWDALIEPVEGDLRVLRGSAADVRMEVPCAPLSGGGVWLNGGPWDLLQCGPPNEQLCREDLMEIGTGQRFSDRDCTRPAGSVRFVTWACREPATLAGV